METELNNKLFGKNDVTHDLCRLCGSDNAKILFFADVLPYHRGEFVSDKWPISECQNCGLIYQSIRPDNNSLSKYYRFENIGDQEYINDWFLKNSKSRYKDWNRYLRIIKKYKQEGTLLDIGCGAGHFLSIAERVGYQVTGQEISPRFISICKDHLDIPILQEDLLSIDMPGESFDVITAFDVVEHLTNPVEVLEKLHFLLKPKGILMVTTHNIGNPFARYYGKRWRHLIPVGHLTYFTKKTLKKMIGYAQFDVLRIGGGHTIDRNPIRGIANGFSSIVKYFILRGIVIGFYKPLAEVLPSLKKWKINYGNNVLDHELLMIRVGNQMIINDDLLLLAAKR